MPAGSLFLFFLPTSAETKGDANGGEMAVCVTHCVLDGGSLCDVSGEDHCSLLKGIEPPAVSRGSANQFTSLARVCRRLSSQGARQVLIMKLSN